MDNFHEVLDKIKNVDGSPNIRTLEPQELEQYKVVCTGAGEGTSSSVNICKKVIRGRCTRHLSIVKHYYSNLLCRERCVIYFQDGSVNIESGFYQLHRELDILRCISCRNANVVELEEVIVDEEACFVFLRYAGMPIMTYIENKHAYSAFVLHREGQLMYRMTPKDDEINVFCEDDVVTCMGQLLSALEFLRNQAIAHKDIKPENVLLNYPLCRWRCAGSDFTSMSASWDHKRPIHLTLCDFNISERVPDGKIYDAQGTTLFTPPEVYGLIDKEEGVDAFARDAWSAGMVGYCMLAGYHPIPLESSSLAYQLNLLRMREECDRITLPANCCNSSYHGLRRVVEGLLDLNPKTRSTASASLVELYIQSPRSP